MANKERMALIELKAKEWYPRKGTARDAFVKGAVWADQSNWVVTAKARPEEGRVVFGVYDYKRQEDGSTVAGLNIATYKDGKFESYTNEDPVMWCYPPLFPTPEDIKKED